MPIATTVWALARIAEAHRLIMIQAPLLAAVASVSRSQRVEATLLGAQSQAFSQNTSHNFFNFLRYFAVANYVEECSLFVEGAKCLVNFPSRPMAGFVNRNTFD